MYFLKNKRTFLIVVVVLLMMGLFLYRAFGTHRTNSYQNSSNYFETSNNKSYPKNSYNNYNYSNNRSFKNVEVSGGIYNLKFRTSKRGNEYTTFKIKTKDNTIYNCYSPKWLSIKNNEILRVSGKYFEVKHVGKYTFYNELDVENFNVIK